MRPKQTRENKIKSPQLVGRNAHATHFIRIILVITRSTTVNRSHKKQHYHRLATRHLIKH